MHTDSYALWKSSKGMGIVPKKRESDFWNFRSYYKIRALCTPQLLLSHSVASYPTLSCMVNKNEAKQWAYWSQQVDILFAFKTCCFVRETGSIIFSFFTLDFSMIIQALRDFDIFCSKPKIKKEKIRELLIQEKLLFP